MVKENIKVVTKNRKAGFNYHLLDTYDAGLVLMGSEIKSIRANRVNISEAFVQDRDGELWLLNAHIATYDDAGVFGHRDPLRPRKLLLHKKEIYQIMEKIRENSFTAVPTMLYLQHGLAKLELAVARGKKNYDKRSDIAKRDAQRQIRRALKNE